MYYPDVSPTAPVTRDDLAHIMALQQLQGLAGGQQPGDASSLSMDALGAANTPGYEAGAPGPGMGIGRGAGATTGGSQFGGGAMSTSNASMVGDPLGDTTGYSNTPNPGDPALASPTFTEPDAVGVPGYGRQGDTTAPTSQSQQAADRAAIAAAALAQSTPMPSYEDTSVTTTSLPEGFGGKSDKGYVPGGYAPNFDQTFTTFAPPGGFPVATPKGEEDLNEMDRAAIAQPSPTLITVNKTSPPGAPPPGAPPPGAPPGAPPGTPGLPTGYDMGSPAPGGTDFGPGAFGGFTGGSGNTGGFGAGYSGSADMGNTQGAQGFVSGGFSSGSAQGFSTTGGFEGGVPGGGGAVGGFGGGATGTGGGADGTGGTGDGAGTGGATGGGGMDAGGSPGGVG